MSFIPNKTGKKIKQHLRDKLQLTKNASRCHFDFFIHVLFCKNNIIKYADIKQIKKMYSNDSQIKTMLNNLNRIGWLIINKQFLINKTDGKPRVCQSFKINIQMVLDDLLYNEIIDSNDFINIKNNNYNIVKEKQSIIRLLGYKENKPMQKNKYYLLTIRDKHNSKCICDCDCGGERLVSLKDLKSGKIKSCGCADKEFEELLFKHDNLHTTIRKENNGFCNLAMYMEKALPLHQDIKDIKKFCDD